MPPLNIDREAPFTDPPQCMPPYCKGEDTVMAYQTYYILEKSRFARWTKRQKPEWFNGQGTVLELYESETERGETNAWFSSVASLAVAGSGKKENRRDVP